MWNTREKIARRRRSGAPREICSGNHGNAVIVAVAAEQFVTEGEKGRIGQAVVFEDDGLVYKRKSPVEAGDNAFSAPHVSGRKVGADFARPVDLGDNISHLLAGLRLAWSG